MLSLGLNWLYADKERAMEWALSEGKSIALLLQTELADHGYDIILKENFVNVNTENESSTDSAVNYSIRAAEELTTRFTGNTLAERIANFIKRESKRLSNVLTFAPNPECSHKAHTQNLLYWVDITKGYILLPQWSGGLIQALGFLSRTYWDPLCILVSNRLWGIFKVGPTLKVGILFHL